MNHWAACFPVFLVFLAVGLSSEAEYFTAAVFEHARESNASTDTAEDIIFKNLACYKKAAEVAKRKGADIIVFPEYGIFPPGSRKHLKSYLETIPDPTEVKIIPCNERKEYQKRPILYTLSCLAKQNGIVVVANMGDIQPCAGQDNCPEDENFHFNTNVVFDRDGTLLVRYYKEYLFYDFGMNLPQKKQDPLFKTDFGTFATFICFDIEYEKMSEVSEREDVDAIVFSAMWGNTPPQRSSVQQWESWSLGNNATLLASNIQMPGYLATGSGIFSGTYGPLAYTFDPDGISKLIIARVPKRGNSFNFSSPNASIIKITMNDTHESLDDGSSVPTECSMKILGKAKDLYKDNRCFEMNMSNYSFVQLVEDSDHVKACLNGICCSLNYSSNGMTENFYLIVYNGTIDYASRYSFCEQTCMLTRCEAHGRNPCATFPLKSQTLFYNVQITAEFSTKHIYPSVVSSGMRLTPLNEWSYGVHQRFSDAYEGYIDFKSSSGQALTSAVLRGRCYDRDPPYFP